MHKYVIVWEPTGFRVLVDGVQRYINTRPSSAKRAIAISAVTGDERTGRPDATTVLPTAVRIDSIIAWQYDPKASPEPASTRTCTAVTPATASPKAVSGGPGRSAWWVAGAFAVALAAAIVVVIRRRRGPRKLRPGHRA
jgi:hypothetical protein